MTESLQTDPTAQVSDDKRIREMDAVEIAEVYMIVQDRKYTGWGARLIRKLAKQFRELTGKELNESTAATI